MLHWPRWEQAGISSVGDICHPTEGRLLSHTEVTEKFNIGCTFLEALSVRLQTPLYWREALTKEWRPPPLQRQNPEIFISLQEDTPRDITALTAKDMYKDLIIRDYHTNAAFNKWSTGEDGIKLNDAQEWNEVCGRTFSSSRETKLQSLQYKIINRVVPCGVHLKQIRIKESNECATC